MQLAQSYLNLQQIPTGRRLTSWLFLIRYNCKMRLVFHCFLLTLFTRYLLSAPYFFGFTNNRLQVCIIHWRLSVRYISRWSGLGLLESKVVSVKLGDTELTITCLVISNSELEGCLSCRMSYNPNQVKFQRDFDKSNHNWPITTNRNNAMNQSELEVKHASCGKRGENGV